MNQLKKWKILKEEDISPSKWFPLYKHKVQLSNGNVVDDFIVAKLGDAAEVVALTDNSEVVMVRQYKHGVREITLEFPAGRIDGRAPEAAAKDELREETGIEHATFEPLGSVYQSPSKDSTIIHAFLARDVKVTVEQDLDETEAIEVVLVPLRDLDAKIMSGEIRAAGTIAILALARLKFPELFVAHQ